MNKLKLFYYKNDPNFGDELSIYAAEKLYGATEYASRIRCNAVFIGSLIQYFLTRKNLLVRIFFLLFPPVLVWGAGFISIDEKQDRNLFRRLNVYACRGFLTLERLKKMRWVNIEKNVAVADPGLLAGLFIDTSDIKKKYDLGVIPHYVDKDNPLLQKITVENSTIIDVQEPPESFIRKLAECKYVIASAMHALIAADSLGIPNVRMILSDKIMGGDYKYNDYYSAFGLDSHMIIKLAECEFSDINLSDIEKNYQIEREQITSLQNALLDVFPYKKKV